eukprot:15055426-Alexandrium_andersonii.AAC.1
MKHIAKSSRKACRVPAESAARASVDDARTQTALWPPRERLFSLHAPHGERQPPKGGGQARPGGGGSNLQPPAQHCRVPL